MAKLNYDPIKTIKISEIDLDGNTQTRAEIDQPTIDDYAAEMSDGAKFDPIDVFQPKLETGYWLGDGFHRVMAAKQAGFTTIRATVHEGGRREAIQFGFTANNRHGKRRTNADKRNQVKIAFNDEIWKTWSDRQIGELVGVSHTFAGMVRKELSVNGLQIDEARTVTRGGASYLMATGNIGKPAPSESLPEWWKEIDSAYFYAMCDERKEIDLEEESLFAENTLMFLKDRADLIARSGEEILAAPDRFKDYESVLFRDPSADREAAATSEPTGRDVPSRRDEIYPVKVYLLSHDLNLIYLPGFHHRWEAGAWLNSHKAIAAHIIDGSVLQANWETGGWAECAFEDLPADAPAASPAPAAEWLSTGDLIHSRKEEWALHLKDDLFYAVDHKNRIIHARGFAHSAAARDAFPGERMAQYTGANIIAKQHDHHKDFSLLLYREIQAAPREISAPSQQPDVTTPETVEGAIPAHPIGSDGTERISPATGEILTVESESSTPESDASPTTPDVAAAPTPAPRPEPVITDVDPNGFYVIKDGLLVLDPDPYKSTDAARADYPMGAASSIGISILSGRAIYERHKLGALNAKLVWPASTLDTVDPDLLPLSETNPASMTHHKGNRAWCASCDSKGLPAYHSRWTNAVADIWHCLQCHIEYNDDVMEEDDMTVSPLPSRPAPKPAPVSPQAIPLFIMVSHDETMRSLTSARIRGDELTLIRPKELADQEIAIWTRLRDGINALLTESETRQSQAVAPQPVA